MIFRNGVSTLLSSSVPKLQESYFSTTSLALPVVVKKFKGKNKNKNKSNNYQHNYSVSEGFANG